MGLLYTPEHGYAAFTVPQFDRFMMRAMLTLKCQSSASPRDDPTRVDAARNLRLERDRAHARRRPKHESSMIALVTDKMLATRR